MGCVGAKERLTPAPQPDAEASHVRVPTRPGHVASHKLGVKGTHFGISNASVGTVTSAALSITPHHLSPTPKRLQASSTSLTDTEGGGEGPGAAGATTGAASGARAAVRAPDMRLGGGMGMGMSSLVTSPILEHEPSRDGLRESDKRLGAGHVVSVPSSVYREFAASQMAASREVDEIAEALADSRVMSPTASASSIASRNTHGNEPTALFRPTPSSISTESQYFGNDSGWWAAPLAPAEVEGVTAAVAAAAGPVAAPAPGLGPTAAGAPARVGQGEEGVQ